MARLAGCLLLLVSLAGACPDQNAFELPSDVMGEPSKWAQEAAQRRPVLFAQVREDPIVERRVLQRLAVAESTLGGGDWMERILLIASGGDTVAYLAGLAATDRENWLSGKTISSITAVDVSRDQLQLARFKLDLLGCPPAARLVTLGHHPDGPLPQPFADLVRLSRAKHLTDSSQTKHLPGADGKSAVGAEEELDADDWSNFDEGRYEALFDAWREALKPMVRSRLRALVGGDEPAADVLNDRDVRDEVRRAFCEVMTPANLRTLFGESAAADRLAVRPFCEHFAHVLLDRLQSSREIAQGPWAAQIITGRFRPGRLGVSDRFRPERGDAGDDEGRYYPWHELPEVAGSLPTVVFHQSAVQEALRTSPAAWYDMIQLSNVLDWSDETVARETLRLARRALRPGGAILLRQLNSRLDLPAIMGEVGLQYRADWSRELLDIDRSFLYRAVHVALAPQQPIEDIREPPGDNVLIHERPKARCPLARGAAEGLRTRNSIHRSKNPLVDRGEASDYYSNRPAFWEDISEPQDIADAGSWQDEGHQEDESHDEEESLERQPDHEPDSWLSDEEESFEGQRSEPRSGAVNSAYLARLEDGSLSLEDFRGSQCAFREAVEHFPRAMSLLVARTSDLRDRMALVENIAEEHGTSDGHASSDRGHHAHPVTFAAFLASINASCDAREHQRRRTLAARIFNSALTGLASFGPRETAVGAFAAIEFAFASISSRIASAVVQRGWVDAAQGAGMKHYSAHAWLDQDHADELFAILDRAIANDGPEAAQRGLDGIELGDLLFRQLYDALL